MANEELTPEEIAEQKRIRKSLIVGGGATGAIGAFLYGGAKGKKKIDEIKAKKIEDGTWRQSRLSKMGFNSARLTEEELANLEKAKKVGKWMAITGGATYAGTKAYEHYKNKKDKD